MMTGNLIETEALKVRCPKCGAAPPTEGASLRLVASVRNSHLERRLIASDEVVKMRHAGLAKSLMSR